MEPSEKSPEMEAALLKLTKVDRRAAILANRCSWCGGPAETFRDELSRREYTISGFCQVCQDETFEK